MSQLPARHHAVVHPGALTYEREFESKVTGWLTSALGSFITFLLCFFVPLIAVPASITFKLIVAIIFSNWFQAWALPVLQRSQIKTQLKQDAQAEATYKTDTYIATLQDTQVSILKEQSEILNLLKKRSDSSLQK